MRASMEVATEKGLMFIRFGVEELGALGEYPLSPRVRRRGETRSRCP